MASTATTIHCEPNFSAPSLIKFSLETADVFIETLSAPASNKLFISSISRTPPPTVRGTKHFSVVFLTISNIGFLSSCEAVISKKQISSAPLSL